MKRVDDSVFGEEQSLLLDHGIMIQPKGEQGADLLSRLARVMISVNMLLQACNSCKSDAGLLLTPSCASKPPSYTILARSSTLRILLLVSMPYENTCCPTIVVRLFCTSWRTQVCFSEMHL